MERLGSTSRNDLGRNTFYQYLIINVRNGTLETFSKSFVLNITKKDDLIKEIPVTTIIPQMMFRGMHIVYSIIIEPGSYVQDKWVNIQDTILNEQ